jgi:hypothetical protein
MPPHLNEQNLYASEPYLSIAKSFEYVNITNPKHCINYAANNKGFLIINNKPYRSDGGVNVTWKSSDCRCQRIRLQRR